MLGSLNGLGYGLTLGIHSRIQSFIDTVSASMKVGNIYVNRSMIGAVVGSQPFAGMGCRAQGPKPAGQIICALSHAGARDQYRYHSRGGNVPLVSLAE